MSIAQGQRIQQGDINNKIQKISFTIRMKNKSIRDDINRLHAEFYCFGVLVTDPKLFRFLQKESFDFELKPGSEFVHETPQIIFRYDNIGSSKYGVKYKGWILRIVNEEGKVVLEKNSSAFLVNTQDLPNLPLPEPQFGCSYARRKCYDKNLKPVEYSSY